MPFPAGLVEPTSDETMSAEGSRSMKIKFDIDCTPEELRSFFGLPEIAGLSAKTAAGFVSFYWGGAMIGRFLGAGLLRRIKAGYLLAVCATCAAVLVTVSMVVSGYSAMWSILAVGLFNSIMFPTIFSLGEAELGPLTGNASGILNMAIVGGAIIPWLVGKVGDLINHAYYPAMTQGETSWGQGIHYALALAVICYLYILFFAVSGSKPNSERYATGVAASD